MSALVKRSHEVVPAFPERYINTARRRAKFRPRLSTFHSKKDVIKRNEIATQ